MNLKQLKRLRWAVRAVLVLGVAASIAGNVLHAQDSIISQAISAWSPLALLLTVELISRVPVHRRSLAVARMVATAVIAGIAAWVSYWHMAAVASRYGETGASPYLLPLSVDGLIVVASISLVELAGRIADQAPPAAAAVVADERPVDDRPPVRFDYDRPIGPEPAPVAREPEPKPVREPVHPQRVTARSLTAADRVTTAHQSEPDATHERIAHLARVSVSTVKRHRPRTVTGSPSGPDGAETVPGPAVNGHQYQPL